MEAWIGFNLIHKSGNTPFIVANLTDGIGYTGISNILNWQRERDDGYNSSDSLGGYINDKYIGCIQGIVRQNTKQNYVLHLKAGITDGKFDVYLNSILLYSYTGNVNEGHILDDLYAYTENEEDNIFSDWDISQGSVLQTLEFKPREAKVSFDFGGRKLQFHNGAIQIIRNRVRPRKIYELKSGGGKRSLDYLLNFYSGHHGAYDKFIFNYDDVDEVCVFSDKIQVDECRELDRIVGYNTTLQIEAVYDNVDIIHPVEGEYFPLTPRGNITETVDWNTNVLDMGAYGRQQTFDVPVRTFSIKVSGGRKDRDKFIAFLRSHGNHTSFYFPYNDARIEVLFPQTVEITDYIEVGKIVGFSCELDLTELRKPNTGAYTSQPIVSDTARRVSLRNFAANGYYLQGEYADGICYRNCMNLLSRYKIIDCRSAFEGSDLTEIPYLNVSECEDFTAMFKNSQIKSTFEMDTSRGLYFSQMYRNSKITHIEKIDISKAREFGGMFIDSKVMVIERAIVGKNGYSLFQHASNLQTIKYMDTSKVTSFDSMFQYCSMLVNLPTLDLGSATNAYSMCYGCAAIRHINVRNTHNITNVSWMFKDCSMLESVTGLNLKNADVVDSWGNNGGIVGMFQNCSHMTDITVADEISYDDARRKYRLLMTNYGLGDGRYNGRYIRHVSVVTPTDVYSIDK